MTAGIVLGSIYLAWYSNQNQIQSLYEDAWDTAESESSKSAQGKVTYEAFVEGLKDLGIDDPQSINVYDNSYASDDVKDGFTDEDSAADLIKDIDDECDKYDDSTPEYFKCYSNDWKGCNWSTVYILNGITGLLIAMNMIFAMVGTKMYQFRVISSCCGTLLCCLSTAAIITTGVFRFNTRGALAALSLTPSKYVGGDITIQQFFDGSDIQNIQIVSDDRTYSTDGSMILITWIFMILFCCTSCCHGGYAQKPSVPDAASSYDALTHQ